jgi:hypothetical protein
MDGFLKPITAQQKEDSENYPEVYINCAKEFSIKYPYYAAHRILWNKYNKDTDFNILMEKLAHVNARSQVPKRYRNKKEKYYRDFDNGKKTYSTGNKFDRQHGSYKGNHRGKHSYKHKKNIQLKERANQNDNLLSYMR